MGEVLFKVAALPTVSFYSDSHIITAAFILFYPHKSQIPRSNERYQRTKQE